MLEDITISFTNASVTTSDPLEITSALRNKLKEHVFSKCRMIKHRGFSLIQGLVVDKKGLLYISDYSEHKIVCFDINSSDIQLIAGNPNKAGFVNGPALMARFDGPRGITFNAAQDTLFIADESNSQVRKLDIRTGSVSTFAAGIKFPCDVLCDANDNVLVTDQHTHTVRIITPAGCTVVIGNEVLSYPARLCLNPFNTDEFFVSSDNMIHKCSISTKTAQLLAGSKDEGYMDSGVGENARFCYPSSMALFENNLFVVDNSNHVIRRIQYPACSVSTFFGVYIPQEQEIYETVVNTQTPTEEGLRETRLTFPTTLCLDYTRKCIYVANKNTIYKIH